MTRKNPGYSVALLDYRKTPTEGVSASLAQRLMSRRTSTLLPTAASLLRPTVNHNYSLQLKRQKAKFFHDKHVRQLPELENGQKLRVAPLRKNQTWEQGTWTEKLSDRSYVVQSGGTTLRRNRQLLKPVTEPSVKVKPDTNPDSVLHREPVRQAYRSCQNLHKWGCYWRDKNSVPGIQTRPAAFVRKWDSRILSWNVELVETLNILGFRIRPPVRLKDFDMKL